MYVLGYNNLDIVAQHLDEERGSFDDNPELNSHHLHSLTVSGSHYLFSLILRKLFQKYLIMLSYI